MILQDLGDSEIWIRFKHGDNEAFSLIYSSYAKKLYLYGLKLTSKHHLIEDAIHDLFSDLVNHRSTLGETTNIQFYLIKSFKRKLLRLIQKEMRYTPEENVTELPFQISYSIEQELILSESHHQRLKKLQRALATLTEHQKEAIYLRFTEELDYEEIADILNISILSCRNLIYRAIKSLRETIDDPASLPLLLIFLHKK